MSVLRIDGPSAKTACALVAVVALLAALVALPAWVAYPGSWGSSPRAGATAPGAWQRLDADEPAPPFSLVDQNGRTITLRDLEGKVAILTFLFTGCTDVCPVLPLILARVDEHLEPVERTRLAYVGVSIDAARDSPERLREFIGTHRLDASRWILLTGSAGALATTADDYGVVVRPDPRLGFVHNTVFVVVDADGRLRAEFHGLATPPAEIARTVRLLLSSSRRSPRPW